MRNRSGESTSASSGPVGGTSMVRPTATVRTEWAGRLSDWRRGRSRPMGETNTLRAMGGTNNHMGSGRGRGNGRDKYHSNNGRSQDQWAG
ncbi:hypothetical protein chiPu_0011874 [Chiloscyllium punctatum]|uniref:Uncharacterized protein n=1 Tax=Chiloscyllium punctatum TaxID=137246 RepID=A0A401SSN0_CHIPU|nr:hypothetical protein [Chiloscyllium punctatum]